MTALQTALAWALLHFLWQGTALAAALAATLLFCRSPRIRYAAASIALTAMLVSFAVTLAVCWPADSHLHATGAAPLPLRLAPAPQTSGSSLDTLREFAPPAWLVPAWTLGVSLFYFYSLLAWMAATRMKTRGAFAAPIEWQARLAELAGQLGLRRPIALLESCLTDVPVVIGYLRPVILMPLGVLAGLTAEQVEAILIHELAHIRRYDYLVNVLQTAVEGMLFYHPAVWWASSVMRREREHCCDDVVVAQQGDARGYAATLARLELSRAAVREPALAATGGNLMNRIHRLVRQPEGPRMATPLVAAGVLALTATIALAAWQTQTQPQPAPQKKSDVPQRQQVQPQTTPDPAPVAQHLVEPLPQRFVEPTPQAEPAPVSDALSPRAQKLRNELETPYRKWLNEDVAYIITDQERAAFKALLFDPEREQFIEQFWLHRDPTPGTPENEMKEEHYRRIAYANEHYASSIPGWKTDRGRVYITYGPPDEIENHPATAATTASQQWRYKWIQGVGTNVIVEFIDPEGTNEYRMTMDPQEKTAANTLTITANVIPIPGQLNWSTTPMAVEVQSRRVNVMIPVEGQGRKTRVLGRINFANGKPAANVVDITDGSSNSYMATFTLLPGSYRVHFTVTDILSGASKQGEIPLDVH